jgi:hypothetical protein
VTGSLSGRDGLKKASPASRFGRYFLAKSSALRPRSRLIRAIEARADADHGGTGVSPVHNNPCPGQNPATAMKKNIIPLEKAKRSVKEVMERFYQDLDDIEEIVLIAKDKDGEWIFANSELENELEWIGSLYKFINKGIMDDEEF